MMSETGNSRGGNGFTLIEVLLSVVLIAFTLVAILQGYNRMAGAYRRAQIDREGTLLLQERLAQTGLDVKTGVNLGGTSEGKEGLWEWSAEVVPLPTAGLFEVKAWVRLQADSRQKLETRTYVGQ